MQVRTAREVPPASDPAERGEPVMSGQG